MLIPPPVGVDETVWAAALGAVRGYCGWHVAPSITEAVQVEGGGGLLLLPSLHVTAVLSITDEDERDVPLAGVRKPRRNGILRGPFRDGCMYTAQITHGYDETPAEVVAIVTDLAEAAGVVAGATSMSAGPFQVSFSSRSAAAQAGVVGLSELQRLVLDRYRLNVRP